MLESRERFSTDLVVKIVESGLGQYHRMLLLMAAVAAFIPPLLSQSELPVNLWFLTRGTWALMIAIAMCIVSQVFLRGVLSLALRAVQANSVRLGRRVGYAIGSEGDVSEAFAQEEEHVSKSWLVRYWWHTFVFAMIWEVSLNSAFLYGIWCLFRSVYI